MFVTMVDVPNINRMYRDKNITYRQTVTEEQ